MDDVPTEEAPRLLRDDRAPERAPKLKPTPETTRRARRRIRCPLCGWAPDRSSRWQCAPVEWPEFFADGCGHAWNTFDTDGVCPGCGHAWEWTACLACHRWSPRGEWYEASDGA